MRFRAALLLVLWSTAASAMCGKDATDCCGLGGDPTACRGGDEGGPRGGGSTNPGSGSTTPGTGGNGTSTGTGGTGGNSSNTQVVIQISTGLLYCPPASTDCTPCPAGTTGDAVSCGNSAAPWGTVQTSALVNSALILNAVDENLARARELLSCPTDNITPFCSKGSEMGTGPVAPPDSLPPARITFPGVPKKN